MLKILLQHRELILTLVKRDIKVRYKASTLGFVWSFGRPLLLMSVLFLVFTFLIRIETDIPYGLHLLTGILPWTFFTSALVETQGSIVANSNVIRKIAVPRVAFPVATILSNLFHMMLAFGVLSLFIAGYAVFSDIKTIPGWEIVFLPFVIVLQMAILLGLGLILSSIYVFYRDVGSFSEIVVMMWFYLTPIIYPAQLARTELSRLGGYADFFYYLWLCNPMTPVIIAYRRVLYGQYLRHAPEVADTTLLASLAVSTVFAFVSCFVGWKLFNRLQSRFVDEL